jgi:hypothetical protein
MAETRKLAAILAADVVGYSKLTGSDEERKEAEAAWWGCSHRISRASRKSLPATEPALVDQSYVCT